MADSPTALLRFRLPEVNANLNVWGPLVNNGFFELLEDAIAGVATIDVTAGNVVLTSTNYVPDQARSAIIKVTGAPGVIRTVTAPATTKVYLVSNETSPGFDLTFTAGAASVTVNPGQAVIVGVASAYGAFLAQAATANPLLGQGLTSVVITPAIANWTAGAPTATVRYSRQGNRVLLTISAFSSTVNSALFYMDLFAAGLPTTFRPVSIASWHGTVIEAGVEVPAYMTVFPTGILYIQKISGAAWAAPSVRGIPYNWTVAWSAN